MTPMTRMGVTFLDPGVGYAILLHENQKFPNYCSPGSFLRLVFFCAVRAVPAKMVLFIIYIKIESHPHQTV